MRHSKVAFTRCRGHCFKTGEILRTVERVETLHSRGKAGDVRVRSAESGERDKRPRSTRWRAIMGER